MDIVAIIIIILISLLLVVTFYLIGLYNNLINAKNRVEDQFAYIDAEIKIKVDLITDLIEIVQKLTKHEEKLINEIETSINKIKKIKTINEKIIMSNNINRALNKVYALQETYIDLKKNKMFITLQQKIEESDNKINYARTFYNDVVLDYNNIREHFPSNIIAKAFNFKEINYYK